VAQDREILGALGWVADEATGEVADFAVGLLRVD